MTLPISHVREIAWGSLQQMIKDVLTAGDPTVKNVAAFDQQAEGATTKGKAMTEEIRGLFEDFRAGKIFPAGIHTLTIIVTGSMAP